MASLAPPYFSILSHKRHDFRKKVTEHEMCVLIFPTTFAQDISHSKKNLARYRHKCENVFMYSTSYFCQILIKLEFFQHISKESPNIKINQNPSCGNRFVRCKRTGFWRDGRDEDDNRFSQLCERVKKLLAVLKIT